MFIYILVILLILFLRTQLSSIGNVSVYRKTENRYLSVVCWVLILISALRGETVGADTVMYMHEYLNMDSQSYAEILRDKDYVGFYLPAKILANLNIPLQIWLGLVAMTYVLPVTALIRRYSNDKLYAMLCFYLMGAFSFSLAGLKQTMAMGLLLVGLLAFLDKKYFYAILFSAWAYYCHKTCVVFVVAYPLYYFRNYKHYYMVLIPVIVFVIVFFKEFLIFGLEQLESERYSAYLELEEDRIYSSTTLIFYLTLLVVSFLFMDKKAQNEQAQTLRFYFGMSACCMAFQTFAFVSASAFRISLYFLPFFAILLSDSFDDKKRKYIKIITALMIIFFFVYTNRHGSSISPYHFIWEGVTVKSL